MPLSGPLVGQRVAVGVRALHLEGDRLILVDRHAAALGRRGLVDDVVDGHPNLEGPAEVVDAALIVDLDDQLVVGQGRPRDLIVGRIRPPAACAGLLAGTVTLLLPVDRDDGVLRARVVVPPEFDLDVDLAGGLGQSREGQRLRIPIGGKLGGLVLGHLLGRLTDRRHHHQRQDRQPTGHPPNTSIPNVSLHAIHHHHLVPWNSRVPLHIYPYAQHLCELCQL